jgi:hypothetical protein
MDSLPQWNKQQNFQAKQTNCPSVEIVTSLSKSDSITFPEPACKMHHLLYLPSGTTSLRLPSCLQKHNQYCFDPKLLLAKLLWLW